MSSVGVFLFGLGCCLVDQEQERLQLSICTWHTAGMFFSHTT